jgi:hypothetical protein
MSFYKQFVRFGLCAALGFSLGSFAQAQGFSALISPPRIETLAKPGQTTRQVVEVSQVGPAPGKFRVYTADWSLNSTGGVDFFEALQPGSCRPWVALEKRDLTVPGNAKTRFRFEITPPLDAPSNECRFAIMFEGLDTSTVSPGALSFPVSGRIGVIVYAGMPGNTMQLQVVGQNVSKEGSKTPQILVSNTGTAHGRVAALLSGSDAKGSALDFSLSTLPIMPGETRTLAITPSLPGSNSPTGALQYPVTVKGSLEWAGKRVPFEHVFKDE